MRNQFTFFLLFFTLTLSAQLGVSGSANFHQARTTFFDGLENANPYELETGWEVAVNYWFRLPTKRVEFLPTVYYAKANSNDFFQNSVTEIGIQAKVNIYPFDFGGDCDCPTFGKQGPQLQKGFFVQFAPGFAMYQPKSSQLETENRSGVTFGLGMGLDIGLSNFMTLTPILAARYGFTPYTDVQFTDVNGMNIGTDQPELTTFQAGVLISFRFDHKKY